MRRPILTIASNAVLIHVGGVGLALVKKLANWAELSEGDELALRHALADAQMFEAKRDILGEGATPEHVYAVLEGWACLYQVTLFGRRQITSLLLPGDMIDARSPDLRSMRHAIGSLTPTMIALIPPGAIRELQKSASLRRALARMRAVNEATLRAGIVNSGRRDAIGRMAHLICELQIRLQDVGLADERGFDLPLTQEQLADALSITGVHVNRTMRDLRKARLMSHRDRRLDIVYLAGLRSIADFDPAYLRAA